jgi:hypothetical protein
MTATDDDYDVRNAGVEALKALALEGLLSTTSINSNLTSPSRPATSLHQDSIDSESTFSLSSF